MLEEWDPQLRGPQGKKVIREMADNHPVIGGILWSIEMMCRQAGYTIEPGTDDAEGEKATELIQQCLDDMETSFADKLGEIIGGMLPYGWEAHEKNFKRRDGLNSPYRDGLIGWEEWPIRGQETVRRWEWLDGERKLAGMWQLGAPDFQEHFIPIEKMLLFRTTARKGNPEGYSMLRRAYVAYKFQKQIQLIEAIGIERDLAGLPVVRLPSSIINSNVDSDVAIYNAWKQVATNIRRNEQDGLVYPSDRDQHGNLLYEVDLLTSGGARQFDTDKVIARYDERIAMSMLASFILLGMESVGSHALGQTMSQMFTVAIGAFLGSVMAVINKDAIPQLLRLNGMNADNPPKLIHGRLERMDFLALAQSLSTISSANQRGAGIDLDTRMDGPLAKFFMEVIGAPDPPNPADIGVTVSQDSVVPPPTPPEPVPPPQPSPMQAGEPKTNGHKAIDLTLEQLMRELEPVAA